MSQTDQGKEKCSEAAWNEAAEAVKGHHDELVAQCHKAMDSLLLYAGLFSAVLTPFNVESYQLLQPDRTDPMLAALQQISAQLNSFSVNPSFINSTQPSLSQDQLQPPFHPPASAVWINTLWFSSLICSLSAASITPIVRQWLYEESKGLSGTSPSRETARLRQYRLNSLIKWKVGAIVLVPSVLLQVSLFLFLAGLVIFLWTIHETVAAVISTLVGALFVFVLVTTVLPIFTSDCCYLSPQSHGMFVISRLVWNGVGRSAEAFMWLSSVVLGQVYDVIPSSKRWSHFEDLVFDALNYSSSWKRGHISIWHGGEQANIADENGFLDRCIASMAYTTTFAPKHIEALPILLSSLPPTQVFSCFSDIHRSWTRMWGMKGPVGSSGKLAVESLLDKPLYCALQKVATVDPRERDRAIGGDWMRLSSQYLLSSYHADQYIPRSAEFLSILARLSIGNTTFSEKTFDLMRRSFYQENLQSDWQSVYSAVTCVTLKDGESFYSPRSCVSVYLFIVIALAESLVASDANTFRKMLGVWFSLRCTKPLLMKIGLTGEQEAWILDETHTLLSSLADNHDIKLAAESSQWFGFRFVDLVVKPLTVICRDVPRGCDIVSDDVLQAIEQIWAPTNGAFCYTSQFSDKRHLKTSLNNLANVIQQQRAMLKSCFRAQQPLATVF